MGVHDTYCVICGITTTKIHWYENDIEELVSIIKAGEFNLPSKSKYKLKLTNKKQKITKPLLLNYIKYVNDISKLRLEFKWCDQIFLITDKGVIKNTNSLDAGDYGSYYGENSNFETQKFMWDDKNRALICHKSCYDLINSKFNYKIQVNDIKNILNDNSMLSNYGKIVNKYTGFQDFPWTSMILNEDVVINFEIIMALNKKLEINDKNVDFLLDPLKNKNNAKRIINIWSPIIKKIKLKPKIKTKIKKNRPSPSDSATLYKVGQIKKGNDGFKYIVTETKDNIHRWKKIL